MSEGDSATEKNSQEITSRTEQAVWTKVASRAWCILRRVIAFSAVAVTVYVTVGCALFGEWWFRFLWGGDFNWHFAAVGLKILLDEYFPIVIGIVLAACIAFVLGNVFKTRLLRFVDKFAGAMLFASAMFSVTTALVVYNTEKPWYLLLDADQTFVMIAENARKMLAASNSPPHIVPPVDFQYIDRNRVDELFNQIEPDLTEKERTVATAGSVKGKVSVGVGGAVNAEGEAGKSVSSTSSFARTTFSTERKCVVLMNYLVDYHGPKYYTNSQGWFLGRENAALALQMWQNRNGPVDYSKIPLEKQLGDPPTEEERREAEGKVKQYQSELLDELNSLNGYVFINGDFDRTIDGDTLILRETFSFKPRKVIFRISLPKSQVPEFQKQSRLRLRVFGDTIRPLSKDGYLDVRLIAAY